MDGSPLLAAGGGASLSPTSPVSVRSVIGPNGIKRKRSAGGPASFGFDSSPGSVLNDDDAGDQSEKKRQPGVKRACNECRQQKVSQESGDGTTKRDSGGDTSRACQRHAPLSVCLPKDRRPALQLSCPCPLSSFVLFPPLPSR